MISFLDSTEMGFGDPSLALRMTIHLIYREEGSRGVSSKHEHAGRNLFRNAPTSLLIPYQTKWCHPERSEGSPDLLSELYYWSCHSNEKLIFKQIAANFFSRVNLIPNRYDTGIVE